MAKKSPRSVGITNAVLLQHLQGMRHALETRMDVQERRVKEGFAEMHERFAEVDHRFVEVNNKFVEMHNRFKRVDDALQRLYTHRVNMLGRIERLEETVGIV
ncbi:MAG: hypothetical protein PHS73_04400 [Candidatus Peribacteraceae bacterium]|nr:hypothetical protein [Candidatus Peribacteraceae bacterium]